jgi:hypothetical protein
MYLDRCSGTHQDADHVLLGVLLQFLQPLRHVVVGAAAGQVEHDQGSRCTFVVGVGYGSVSLLPSCVPDLSLNAHVVQLDRLRAELHPNGGLRLLDELVLFESREEVGLAHPRIFY